MNISKSSILALLSLFAYFSQVYLCLGGTSEKYINDIITNYNKWSDPGKHHDNIILASTKLRQLLAPECKVTTEGYQVEKCVLSGNEFIEQLNKTRFALTIHQVILNPPRIKKKGDMFVVDMTKGFLRDNYIEIIDSQLSIEDMNGEYLIIEIHNKYREPAESEEMKIFSSLEEEKYDKKKGLGARYLGGGVFGLTSPSISPDGKMIVFASLRHKSSELYMVNYDGSGLRRLTISPYWEVSPCFSPDGKNIIFISDRDNYMGEPYVLDYKNNTTKMLIREYRNVKNVCFSTDGKHIAFTATENNRRDIYILARDSQKISRLTNTGHDKFSLVFSTCGNYVYFSEQWYENEKQPALTVEIFSVGVKSADIKQLTGDRTVKKPFGISAMGEILFLRENKEYKNEIWAMNPSDSNSRYIIGSKGHGMNEPKLTPDKRKVVFVDDMDVPYVYEIYSLSMSDSHIIKKITHHNGYVSGICVSSYSNNIIYLMEPKGEPLQGKGNICIIPIEGGQFRVIATNY